MNYIDRAAVTITLSRDLLDISLEPCFEVAFLEAVARNTTWATEAYTEYVEGKLFIQGVLTMKHAI